MIGRTNAGGGAGGGLNFKVVGGASAPSNPKGNTIWVTNPNLLDFNAWANNISVHNGTKSVSGNSVTFSANASDCYTDFGATSPAKIPCTSGKTYIMQWDHSGGDGEVYLFPNASVEKLVMTGARAGKIECTATEGVTFFTFRVGVSAANTTATYSNIRIMEKPAEITSWHFGVDEPNFYNLKTRTEGDAHTIMAPHKVSAGDILNFKIPKKVLVTREAICIRCPETGKSYYVRNGNGTAAGSWSAGTTVGVLLSDTSMPVGSYGSGSGTALIRAWEKCYHTEGTLWIQSGASSPVAFNALKKNGITVYPISAKQYVGGAWVEREAKSYQGGEWVEWWNGHLYEYGDQHEQVTGGWTNTGYKSSGYSTLNATFNTDNIYITGVNGVGPGGVATVNKIDLKGRTKLKMLFNADSVADTSFLVVLANKSDDMVNAPSAKASLTAGSQQTVSLDITAITEGYIGITSTRPTYIYDVWLE